VLVLDVFKEEQRRSRFFFLAAVFAESTFRARGR